MTGNNWAILSPYVIPSELSSKKVNLGDGFILRGIERQIGTFKTAWIFSSRRAPKGAEFSAMQAAGTVILGGANQLSDDFTVWPGATGNDIRRNAIRFVPFGIGLNGTPDRNRGFTENARDVIAAIHERIEFSSWRCGRTVKLLEQAFPELAGRFLMTGCPVLYDSPLLESDQFDDREGSVAVTVTERGDFWEREARTLEFVSKRFRKARKTMVLHQVFGSISPYETWPVVGGLLGSRARLRNLARKLGFHISAPQNADELIAFYRSTDLHIGSRLHAHLLFLSQNKRSFLIGVDERSVGFAEFLGFPLVDPLSIEQELGFNFEVVRSNARKTYTTMRNFLRSLETST